MKTDLASLLAPLSLRRFLATFWAQQPRHFPSKGKRFTKLMPWSVLNRVLYSHRLQTPHLRLWKEGRELPREAYLRDDLAIGGVKVPSVNVSAMHTSLRDGASLILNGVEHLYEPVRALAEAFELELHAPAQVNAYAAWAEAPGFDTHWDDHDVFILQVTGRKKWRVFEPSSSSPLFPSRSEKPPQASPRWEGTMRPGDMLYIPRGWWHDACAMGEPTLHLTFGIRSLTGLDIVEAMARRLKESPVLRQEVPRFESSRGQTAYERALKEALRREIDSLKLGEFLLEHDGMARVFEQPSLPWAIATPKNRLADSQVLTWRPRRRVQMRVSGGQLRFTALGTRWAFSEATESIVRKLEAERRITVSAVRAHARKAGHSEATVSEFLVDLLRRGLIGTDS